MRFRHSPLPRRLDEVMCYLLIGGFLPIIFTYDVILVLPAIHEPGSFPYMFTLLTGIYLVLNVEGNLLACMMIDTSVDHRIEVPPEGIQERLNWRHCVQCNRLSPPRSWHCKKCRVCILKRDHHCTFSGCCIGHQNQRYFLCFILNLLVGSIFALIYSSVYMWVLNGSCYLKVMVSWPKLTSPLDDFVIKVQLMIYTLHVLVFISSLIALSFYVPIALRGEVYAEKGNRTKYNNGLFLNLRSIFGKRMHLVWLSPLVKSELPEDGYTWNSNTVFNSSFTQESVL